MTFFPLLVVRCASFDIRIGNEQTKKSVAFSLLQIQLLSTERELAIAAPLTNSKTEFRFFSLVLIQFHTPIINKSIDLIKKNSISN